MAVGGFQIFVCEKCRNWEQVFHTDIIIPLVYPPTQKECKKCGGVMFPNNKSAEKSKQKDDIESSKE